MEYVSGEILTVDGFQKGYLGFEQDIIVETGGGKPPKKPLCTGLITPSFINAHTHIGDSFVRMKNIDLSRDIEDLVAPPHGLKHRLLDNASEEEIVTGMKRSIQEMIKSGTTIFSDFRENGIKGIELLRKTLEYTSLSSLVLSRPKKLRYNRREVDFLLKNSDGIGVSSISDWEYSELEKLVKFVKNKDKLFALHASERIREDVDLILDLKPDFLVHMVFATDGDLERVKNNNVPIVICPRSNSFFGLKPKFSLLKKHQINLLIGTDNAMLNPPRVIDEIKHIRNISKEFSTDELLQKITYGARKALNLDYYILGPNSPAEFTVLDKKSLNPLYISYDKSEGYM